MIRFPLTDLLNQQECYNLLLDILHPQGLCCPYGHFLLAGQCPHMCDRAPILNYRCRECGTVFNVFTGTVWAGAPYSCAKIMMILRGFTQGIPTLQLADELDCRLWNINRLSSSNPGSSAAKPRPLALSRYGHREA